MNPDERIGALKRAEWRVRVSKMGYGICRVCGGRTKGKQQPYCWRHWRALLGFHDLMAAVVIGERLDEADELVRLSLLYTLKAISHNHFDLGPVLSLRHSTKDGLHGWNLFLKQADGEHVLEFFRSLADARRYLISQRETRSTRNRWASKTLIG